MWKNTLIRIVRPMLQSEQISVQSLRTTFVVKRRWPPGLHKVNGKPKPLRGRHYVYDLVKDTNIEKQPDIDVILVSYVEGYGNAGDKIKVKSSVAYNYLLLPGLAVYASPENKNKYENKSIKREEDIVHSSPFAQRTVNVMSRITLTIIMNKDVPWVLEPWHIRSSFRKAGFHVADEAIEMPKKSISGPDLSLEDKEFYITLTVNNIEKVNVRCRIHHWSTNVTEKLPYVAEHWKIPREPLFQEDSQILASLPSIHIVAEK